MTESISTAINAPSLADAVYAELSMAIRDGRYHPGERIKEASVSKQFNVSRTPVREAIRRLQSEGRVTIEPQRGAVVSELNHQEVAELYAFRQHLEGIAARFAAQHASEAEIEIMGDILMRSKNTAGDNRLLNQINWELHYAIYHAAQNRFLLKSIEAISDAMALLRGAHHIPENRPAELYTEHKRIVDAIHDRAPQAAQEAAENHIKNAYKTHLHTTKVKQGQCSSRGTSSPLLDLTQPNEIHKDTVAYLNLKKAMKRE